MRDIYETYNSKYCYPGTTVLKNKLNIMNIEKLQTYEAKIRGFVFGQELHPRGDISYPIVALYLGTEF